MQRRIFLGLVIFLMILPQTVLAQATTATVEGTVTDPNGEPIKDATVVVTNTRTALARATVTDAFGRYLIQGLPPAPYQVVVEAANFFASPVETVLQIGRSSVVDVKMSVQQVEVITVTSERAVFDVSKPEVSTVISERQIEELPLINRDFTDLASLAPGAKPKQTGQVDPTKNEDIYRPFTIGAGNGREVNIQIDGGDTNDRAVGTWTQGYTAEAIQEFAVITDQYKAEYGRASHGVVNVITKTGSNELSGSAFGLYRDDSLRSENFSERLSGAAKSPSERRQWGGSLGGRIVSDKLFFFTAYEHIEEESPTAYSPNVTGFARTSGFAGQSFSTGLDRDLFTAKLNWNINSSNTAFLRYALDENTFANDQGGALTLDVFNGSSTNEGYSLLGNWTALSGNFLNELTLHVNDFENGIVSNTPTGSSVTPGAGSPDFDFITTQNYDLFSLGRNGNTPQATLQAVDQFRNDFTWLLGDHDIKVGIDYLDVTFDEALLGALVPTISFNFQTGVTPDTVDANGDDLSIINTVAPNNPGLIPASDYTQIGIYAQDTWRLNDRLSIYYGLRYDKDAGVFDTLTEGINRTFYESVAAGSPGRFENTFPEDTESFAPRLGFVYSLDDSDKNVIRGSFGQFNDKVIENLTIFGTQNLSPVVFPNLPSLNCGAGNCAAGFDPDGPGGVGPLPVDFTWNNWLQQGALRDWYETLVSSLGPLNTLNGQVMVMPAPDWKTPVINTLSLGWGHRINNNWSVDTNAIYSEGSRQYRWLDVRSFDNSGLLPGSPAAIEIFFVTNGRSEYSALQSQLRGRSRKYDLTFNLTVSESRGTQDSGASANESGTLDIFSGGNRRFTGADPADNPACGTPGGPICVTEADEWGPISGDQTVWASVFASYRLPYGIVVSGDASWGSDIAFWQSAGYDWNNDGNNNGSEYIMPAGSGNGDDFFAANLRVAKTFQFGGDFELDVFGEVFNVTNNTNYGLFVDQTEFNLDTTPNPNYENPTGNEVGQSRTYNVGLRFRF